MHKRFASDVMTVGELAAASGNPPRRIEGFSRDGTVIPYKQSNGAGSRRLFKGAIPILDATEARELMAAGYSSRQILRRFAVQRAALASLAPEAQVVERFRLYIATITMLADTFGRGPGYDEWLATQQAQLRRMEKALARPDAKSDRPGDDRLLNLLPPAASEEDAPQALAG